MLVAAALVVQDVRTHLSQDHGDGYAHQFLGTPMRMFTMRIIGTGTEVSVMGRSVAAAWAGVRWRFARDLAGIIRGDIPCL